MGTPQEFEAIIDAGFAEKLRIDYWFGHHGVPPITQEQIDKEQNKSMKLLLEMTYNLTKDQPANPFHDNVEFISGGVPSDKNYRSNFMPTGRCHLLTENDECSLHAIGLKPEQGRESCCKTNDDKHNVHYVHMWASEEGKRVIEKFKKVVNYEELA